MRYVEGNGGSLQSDNFSDVSKSPDPYGDCCRQENPWIQAHVTFAAGEPQDRVDVQQRGSKALLHSDRSTNYLAPFVPPAVLPGPLRAVSPDASCGTRSDQ